MKQIKLSGEKIEIDMKTDKVIKNEVEDVKVVLTITITKEADWEDLHIIDDFGHSCNYGDSNYDKGMTSKSIGECVAEFMKDYHRMK